jgi:hypothetical protein
VNGKEEGKSEVEMVMSGDPRMGCGVIAEFRPGMPRD